MLYVTVKWIIEKCLKNITPPSAKKPKLSEDELKKKKDAQQSYDRDERCRDWDTKMLDKDWLEFHIVGSLPQTGILSLSVAY